MSTKCMKINVKINTIQNTNICFCSFTIRTELKECLTAVGSNFRQVTIDTAFDQ